MFTAFTHDGILTPQAGGEGFRSPGQGSCLACRVWSNGGIPISAGQKRSETKMLIYVKIRMVMSYKIIYTPRYQNLP